MKFVMLALLQCYVSSDFKSTGCVKDEVRYVPVSKIESFNEIKIQVCDGFKPGRKPSHEALYGCSHLKPKCTVLMGSQFHEVNSTCEDLARRINP